MLVVAGKVVAVADRAMVELGLAVTLMSTVADNVVVGVAEAGD